MAIKVYRCTDKIAYTLHHSSGDKVVFVFQPLTLDQKAEMSSMAEKAQTGTQKDMIDIMKHMLRVGLKEIKGLDCEDGPFVLKPENGMLTEDDLNTILNLDPEIITAATSISSNLLNGVSKEIINPQTQLPITNITFGESIDPK